VTPREVLAEMECLGYRLSLRPGGLRLSGKGEPLPDLLALIAEHREALLSFLKDEARRWRAHEESLAAGRIVPFQAHLLPYVHPSIRHLVGVQEPPQNAPNGHRNSHSINNE